MIQIFRQGLINIASGCNHLTHSPLAIVILINDPYSGIYSVLDVNEAKFIFTHFTLTSIRNRRKTNSTVKKRVRRHKVNHNKLFCMTVLTSP